MVLLVQFRVGIMLQVEVNERYIRSILLVVVYIFIRTANPISPAGPGSPFDPFSPASPGIPGAPGNPCGPWKHS